MLWMTQQNYSWISAGAGAGLLDTLRSRETILSEVGKKQSKPIKTRGPTKPNPTRSDFDTDVSIDQLLDVSFLVLF